MKKTILVVFLFAFLGCSEEVPKKDLPNLNGYWEIEQVIFPDGTTKEYTVSTTVDYIELNETEGFRKKVRPQFNGTYETSHDAETFSISKKDDTFIMHYKTGLSEWSENLVALNGNTFSVVNEEGLRYDYRRFEPIVVQK
ncbi:hypothetical protein RQM65_15025 [Pricia sp. S334]|uniref:Lipocalin-like domain-containing protein n=1 Tax=Pricia mediterranea TaxID=3076079 RepID=A0ABU3L9B7_9FLAO|nr:lipocalin family protein [Pricia sp. S334]MDT7829978.1 hypothetical protein [Pricia sp. S334]